MGRLMWTGPRSTGPPAQRRLFALLREQEALPLDAPLVTGEPTVAANDAMTGHDNRDAIARARLRHGATRARRADRVGDLRVRSPLARRNGLKRVPNAALKLGSGQIERYSIRRLLFRMARAIEDGANPGSIRRVVAIDGGLRKIRAKRALDVGVGRTELDRTNSAFGRRNQHAPDRCVFDRIGDPNAGAAAPVGSGRHTQRLRGALVDAAARSESGFVRRSTHRVTRAQPCLEALHATLGLIGLRRHAYDALERTLQVRRAHPDRRGQLVEGHETVGVRVEVFARALDGRMDSRFFGRLATATRTKACALRVGGRRKEFDVRAQRAPRRARRFAEHTRRAHGVHEAPIVTGVSPLDRVPGGGTRDSGRFVRSDGHGDHDLLPLVGTRNLPPRRAAELSEPCSQISPVPRVEVGWGSGWDSPPRTARIIARTAGNTATVPLRTAPPLTR